MFSYKWACPTLFFSLSCTSLHNPRYKLVRVKVETAAWGSAAKFV
jgi:hypothetical protein